MMQQKRKVEEAFREDFKEMCQCQYCSFETNNIDELDEHIQIHEEFRNIEQEEEEEVVLVERCKRKSGKRIKEKNPEIFTCSLCPYSTKRKYDLPKHLLTHSTLDTTTVYKCSQCSYETKRKNDMPKHMLAHCTNVQMFKCPECPYQTKRKNDLPKHQLCHQTHDSVPVYKCNFCEYFTKRKGDLPKHELNHTDKNNLRMYHCSECRYRTKRRNDLHKHMLVHCDRHITGVFKCLKCPYATDRVHTFSKHVQSNCTSWGDSINLEHLMLEDILASADKEGIHVVLNENDDGEIGTYLEDEEYVEVEQGAHSYAEAYQEFMNKGQDSSDSTDEILEEDEVKVFHNVDKKGSQAQGTEENGIFNLNLGEFSVDVDSSSRDEVIKEGETYVQQDSEGTYTKEKTN